MGGGGWGVAGLCGNKANSAKFQVKLPTGAELGKSSYGRIEICIFFYIISLNDKIQVIG